MNSNSDYSVTLNNSIGDFLKSAVTVVGKNPVMLKTALQAARFQKKAAQVRMRHDKEGLQVPPYMIISITNRCNLSCKGCYSMALHKPSSELNMEKLRSVIEEARDLGVSFIFLAGGEPLMRSEILDVTQDFPEVIFPLFTNGLLITDEIIGRLKKQRHVIPTVSIEGNEVETDGRRGLGIYNRLQGTFEKLKRAGLFYGLSFTVTGINFDTLTDEGFMGELINAGTQLFFFNEYVPVREDTAHLVISDEQRAALAGILASFRARLPGLFVSFPGDEELFGGCLSAGRGFVHISAEGNLEPCPFAPYSDANLREMSLKEALQSELLKKIRENHEELMETKGGCALWEKREWVKTLI